MIVPNIKCTEKTYTEPFLNLPKPFFRVSKVESSEILRGYIGFDYVYGYEYKGEDLVHKYANKVNKKKSNVFVLFEINFELKFRLSQLMNQHYYQKIYKAKRLNHGDYSIAYNNAEFVIDNHCTPYDEDKEKTRPTITPFRVLAFEKEIHAIYYRYKRNLLILDTEQWYEAKYKKSVINKLKVDRLKLIRERPDLLI